jgi:hypothetical protein
MTDLENPFKPYMATFWTYALLDYPKQVSVNWKWVDVVSDNGIMLK